MGSEGRFFCHERRIYDFFSLFNSSLPLVSDNDNSAFLSKLFFIAKLPIIEGRKGGRLLASGQSFIQFFNL